MHHFRESVYMGRTRCSRKDVDRLLHNLDGRWKGKDYDLVRRNCCHFSKALCRELAVGPFPRWVLHAAQKGENALKAVEEGMVLRASSRKEEVKGYKYGDCTIGIVQQLIRRGRSGSRRQFSEKERDQGFCSAFQDFIMGVCSRRWLTY